MDLWSLVVILLVLGFLAWLVTQPWVPLEDRFKKLISMVLWVLAVILAVFAVLTMLGVPAYLKGIRVPTG